MNPYDPAASPDQQAPATLAGRLVLHEPSAAPESLEAEVMLARVGLIDSKGLPVRTADGAPLYARLELLSEEEASGLPQGSAGASFEMVALRPDRYRLRVDGVGARYAPPGMPEIDLRPGMRGNIGDIVFVSITSTEEGPGSIHGTVKLADRAGETRIVELYRQSGAGPELFTQTRTDAHGGFSLSSLPVGTYALRAGLTGFTPDHRLDLRIGESGGATLVHRFESGDALLLHPDSTVLLPIGYEAGRSYYTNLEELVLQVLDFGFFTQMRISTDPAFVGAGEQEISFSAQVPNAQIELPDAEGPIEIFAQFTTDPDGDFFFISPTFSTTVIRDTTPPEVLTATILEARQDTQGRLVAPGPNIPVVVEAMDEHSAISGLAVAQPADNLEPDTEDLDFDPVVSTGGLVRKTILVPVAEDADGEKRLFAYAMDKAGNVSAPFELVTVLDREAPDVSSATVTIRGKPEGALETTLTRVTTVTVDIDLPLDTHSLSGVVEMRVWNGDYAEPTTWRPIEESISWILAPGDGQKIVNVKVRDAAGNVSSPFWGSIVLDQTPPSGPSLHISRIGSVQPATHVSEVSVRLHPHAEGASWMTFSNDPSFAGAEWVTYDQAAFPWTLEDLDCPQESCPEYPDGEARTVYALFRDEVFNISEVARYSVVLDREPPGTPVVILHRSEGSNPGPSLPHGYSRHLNVAAEIQSPGHSSSMLVSWGDLDESDCPEAGAMTEFALTGSMMVPFTSDGPKRLCVRMKDAAGNVGEAGVANIRVLTAAPVMAAPLPSYAMDINHSCVTFDVGAEPEHIWKWQVREHSGSWKDAENVESTPEGTSRFDVRLFEDDVNLIEFRAVDHAGNLGHTQLALIGETSSTFIPTHLELKHVCADGRFAILKDTSLWWAARIAQPSRTCPILLQARNPDIALIDLDSGSLRMLSGTNGMADIVGQRLGLPDLHRLVDAACAPDDDRVLLTFADTSGEDLVLRTAVWPDPLQSIYRDQLGIDVSEPWMLGQLGLPIASIDIIEWTGAAKFNALIVGSRSFPEDANNPDDYGNRDKLHLISFDGETPSVSEHLAVGGQRMNPVGYPRKLYGLALYQDSTHRYFGYLVWNHADSQWEVRRTRVDLSDDTEITSVWSGLVYSETNGFSICSAPWGTHVRPAHFAHYNTSPLHSQFYVTAEHASSVGTALRGHHVLDLDPTLDIHEAHHSWAMAVERMPGQFSWVHPNPLRSDTLVRHNSLSAHVNNPDYHQRYAHSLDVTRPFMGLATLEPDGTPTPGAPELIYHTRGGSNPAGIVIGLRNNEGCYRDPATLP